MVFVFVPASIRWEIKSRLMQNLTTPDIPAQNTKWMSCKLASLECKYIFFAMIANNFFSFKYFTGWYWAEIYCFLKQQINPTFLSNQRLYLIFTLDSIPSTWPSTQFCLSWTWKLYVKDCTSNDDDDDDVIMAEYLFLVNMIIIMAMMIIIVMVMMIRGRRRRRRMRSMAVYLFLVMASAAKTWSPSWCSCRPSILIKITMMMVTFLILITSMI